MTDSSQKAARDKSDAPTPSLNLNAASFVPTFKAKKDSQSTTNTDNPQASLNLDAPVFKPSKTGQASSFSGGQNSSPAPYMGSQYSMDSMSGLAGGLQLMSQGADSLNGYINPFAQKA